VIQTDLVVGRQLHCRDTVDVFLDPREQVVPTSNQSTLVLIVDQIQLVRLPHLANLHRRDTQAHVSTLNTPETEDVQ